MSIRRPFFTFGLFFLSMMISMQSVLASVPAASMILRVRLPDGSLQKVMVDLASVDKVSLRETLNMLENTDKDNLLVYNDDDDENKVQIQAQTSMQSPMVDVEDASQSLESLGLRHGSMVTLRMPKAKRKKRDEDLVSAELQNTDSSKETEQSTTRWNPFPELAKNYDAVAQSLKRRKHRQQGKYSDLLDRQSQMHVVEPQLEGFVKRIYMCRTSAEKFRNSCISNAAAAFSKSAGPPTLSVGVLLGTMAREKVDQHKRARTSLSSTTDHDTYCQVAKVQALVSFPSTENRYDASRLEGLLARSDADTDDQTEEGRILRVANWLGLSPVGWIFLYQDDRLDDVDCLPVLASDAQTAAQLQVLEMKATNRADSSRAFCTLAMDASTGATDAFQLSDVSVQMQAEGLLMAATETTNRRVMHCKHPVIVDGEEVTEFDSVLCLVNTAVLSHDGAYAKTTNAVKKSGMLTKKTKKALLQALDANDDILLLDLLSDFNLLVALDERLGTTNSEALCKAVKLKRLAGLHPTIKDRLRSILDTH